MKAFPCVVALVIVALVSALGTLYMRTMEARELATAVTELEMRLSETELDAKELQGKNEQLNEAATQQKRFITELEMKWQVENEEMKKKIMELEGCQTEKNELMSKLGMDEEELKKVKGQLESDRQNLEGMINNLKTQLEIVPNICNLVGKTNPESRKLCGFPEPPKEEEKKEEKQNPPQ